MAMYAIVALGDSNAEVDRVVAEKFEDRFQIEAGKWLVLDGRTTARQVSEYTGLRTVHSHVVFAVRGSSGRARADLWEWLTSAAEREHGNP